MEAIATHEPRQVLPHIHHQSCPHWGSDKFAYEAHKKNPGLIMSKN